MPDGKSNFIAFRNALRVTRSDGSVQEIAVPPIPSRKRKAAEVIEGALNAYAMLSRLNELTESLRYMRRLADAGDENAKYNANIQIGLINELLGMMDASGVRTRFEPYTCSYEIL